MTSWAKPTMSSCAQSQDPRRPGPFPFVDSAIPLRSTQNDGGAFFEAHWRPMTARPNLSEPLLVACLCAQWCRTCDAYRDTLVALRDAFSEAHPEAALRVVWVDIEDESELIGDLDIEDFPTILLAHGDGVRFFGPLLPHAQTLDRLVRSALAGDLPPLAQATLAPDVRALPARLRTHATV
jgi:thiol-disulfide isomerase/thioredoxin